MNLRRRDGALKRHLRWTFRVWLVASGFLLVALEIVGPSPARAAPRSQGRGEASLLSRISRARILDKFYAYSFDDARTAMNRSERKVLRPGDLAFLQGINLFHLGDYTAASEKFSEAGNLSPQDIEIAEYKRLNEAAGKAIEGHENAESENFQIRFPPRTGSLRPTPWTPWKPVWRA